MLYYNGSRKDAQKYANAKNKKVKYHNPFWLKGIYEIIKPNKEQR